MPADPSGSNPPGPNPPGPDWSTFLTRDERDALAYIGLDWDRWVSDRLENFLSQAAELRIRNRVKSVSELPQNVQDSLIATIDQAIADNQ